MVSSPRSDVRRFAFHVALGSLAWGLSNAFSAAFLLREGLRPAQIFLIFAAVNALRFALRPIVLTVAPRIGVRRTLILGAAIIALSYPALALVHGVGIGLLIFVAASSLGQVFYFTTYHVFFAALSDDGRFGMQVGLFQALGIVTAVVAPAVGGLLLATRGAWLSFGMASLIALAGIAPLLRITEPQVARKTPRRAYAAAKNGARLYFTDGWIQVSLSSAWGIVLFEALHDRYESYGGTLSLAALAAALAGIVLGRLIDKGHARSIAWINAGILAASLLLRALTFGNAAVAVAVAIGTVMVSGIYLPTWMAVVYSETKVSPCPFRFQFAAEGGWDAGAVGAGLAAAGFCAIGLPVEAAILLALPMVVVQVLLLDRGYARQAAAAPPGLERLRSPPPEAAPDLAGEIAPRRVAVRETR